MPFCDHATLAESVLAKAVTPVGAGGAVTTKGVTALLGVENGLQPLLLQAFTSKTYEEPFVSAGTVPVIGAVPTPVPTVRSATPLGIGGLPGVSGARVVYG